MTDSGSRGGDATTAECDSAGDSGEREAFFGVLADRRRRCVVEALGECRTPIPVASLADEVAVRERPGPVGETSARGIPAEERERVAVSLFHTHLPKLADWNVVEFARERGEVALSEEGERVQSFLDDVTDVLL